jgi:hypothetical protein
MFVCAALLVVFTTAVPQYAMSSSISSPAKQVINTPWWPAGTEKTEESVGILSRGRIFLTGMMEHNSTDAQTLEQEIFDVRDIMVGGSSDLKGLLSCLVNVPTGKLSYYQDMIEASFQKQGIDDVVMNYIEMIGEYGGYFKASMSCVGSQHSLLPKYYIEYENLAEAVIFKMNNASNDVVSEGDMYLHVKGNTSDAVFTAINNLTNKLRGVPSFHNDTDIILRDCHGFVLDEERKVGLQNKLQTLKIQPSSTIIVVKNMSSSNASLTCFAQLSSKNLSHQSHSSNLVNYVKTEDLIFVDGIYASQNSGIDGMEKLGLVLKDAGSSLREVVNCLFYVKNSTNMDKLFEGFSFIFNLANPPPPSRSEFGVDLPSPYEVLMKCIAAVPE